MIEKNRIFITGAASGLGRAIAVQYAQQGWKVCVADVHETRGIETINLIKNYGVECFFQYCDVSKEDDLQKAADELEKHWGGVDVVVNNAGVASAGEIDKTSVEDWKWIIDINLLGVVYGCKVFTELFKKQGSGNFVNIASMAGLLVAPNMGSYNVTKAGVVALSETLQAELEPYGIQTTVVCPAFFQTNLAESLRSSVPGMDNTVRKLLASSNVTADDIAKDIYKAVKKGKFWVLPHFHAKLLWILKRHLPAMHSFFSVRLARQMASKARRVAKQGAK